MGKGCLKSLVRPPGLEVIVDLVIKRLWNPADWDQILVLSLASSVTVNKFLNPSEPQFPYL